jgi:hypothetical protein
VCEREREFKADNTKPVFQIEITGEMCISNNFFICCLGVKCGPYEGRI